MLDNPEKASDLAQSAQHRAVEMFDYERLFDELEALFIQGIGPRA